LSWNDLDIVSIDNDGLFGVADQISEGPRAPPEPLDSIGHVFRLIEKGISQVGGPIHITRHHLQNAWIVGNCPDRFSPNLLIDALYLPSAVKPRIRIGNLCRICRGRQHLGQQRVLVERYGGKKVFKLLVRERYRIGQVLVLSPDRYG
jgi:hypothetical protein